MSDATITELRTTIIRLQAEQAEAKRNPVDRLNEALINEEEAVKAERQRIAEAVEGLDTTEIPAWPSVIYVKRADVLALLEPTP